MCSIPRPCVVLLVILSFFCGRSGLAAQQQPDELCLQQISLDEGNSGIQGTVVDDEKHPIAGAEVHAIVEADRESRGGGAPPIAVTLGTTASGETGEFLIIVPFVGTQIRIRATRWGFNAAEESVTVGNRQIVRVQIVLQRRTSVTTQGTPNTALQTIYFATDRALQSTGDPEKIFGTRRSPHLNYGVATVAVPASSSDKVAPFGVSVVFMDNPNLDTKLEKISGTPSLWENIRTAMAGRKSQDLYIFIHGYNNTFDEAARRAALIAYAAHLPGPTILYSWPSQGSWPKYVLDETNVKWTQFHFQSFLRALSSQTGNPVIHLIAHSMGNRAIVDALEYFARRGGQPHFGQVILAAPDLDHDTYRDVAGEFGGTAEHVTLYGSVNDQAIRLSRALHGYWRAGDGGQRIPVIADKHVDAIDASAVPADLLGHAYLETKDILSDIQALTQHRYPPRDHLTPSTNGEGAYWIFNP